MSQTNVQPLFEVVKPQEGPGPIEISVLSVRESLEAEKLLTVQVDAKITALTSIARAVDSGMTGGEKGVSVATANLAKLLMESLADLPEPMTGVDPFYDALDEQLKQLTKAALQ